MYKINLLKLKTYNIYTTHKPLDLEMHLMSVSCGWYSCVGLLADYLLIRLNGVVVWEYEIIFNTKYFIINSKLTALHSCNPSSVLNIHIATYIHTQVAVYWRVKIIDTHPYPRLILRAQTNISFGEFLASSYVLECFHYIITQVAVYWIFGW